MDTRVTNAITGGDLSAPFTFDFMTAPFQNAYNYGTSATKLDVNTSTKLQYTSYAEYHPDFDDYDALITRTYTVPIKISDAKCTLTFAGACITRSGYQGHIDHDLKVEVLNSAGAKLMETASINSTTNTTVKLSLASLKGQSIKLRISMISGGYPWRPRGFTIAQLLISNQ